MPCCWTLGVKILSTNLPERLNKEVKRRADIVGIFINERANIRLVSAVLLEVNDDWQLQHRYMQTEVVAEFTPPMIDVVPSQLSTVAARPVVTSAYIEISTTLTDTTLIDRGCTASGPN